MYFRVLCQIFFERVGIGRALLSGKAEGSLDDLNTSDYCSNFLLQGCESLKQELVITGSHFHYKVACKGSVVVNDYKKM